MAKRKLYLAKEDIIIFTSQLALVVDSDMSLFEGIELIKSKSDNNKLEGVLDGLLDELREGKSLGEAMKVYEEAFTPFVCNMVELGENSGDLINTLNQISYSLEKEVEISNKVKSAVTYPIILSVLMLGVIVLLVTQILPMFNEILASLGGEMPGLTRVIMDIGFFIGRNLWFIVGLVAILVALYVYFNNTVAGKKYFDRLKLKLPVINDIIASLIAVRFARNLAVIIRSGISLSIGMNMIKPIIENSYVRTRLDDAIEALDNGESPDKVIEALDLFPWVLIKLFGIAQSTGHMDEMLDKAANVMEKETEVRLERVTTVIEPILITILSLIIGVILISVILPIISIMNSIG